MNGFRFIKKSATCIILAFLCCLSINAQQTENTSGTKTLSPRQTEKILRKAMKRLNWEYRSDAGKESRFYLSQTNLLNGKKSDVQEAVLNACSNITLRNISVVSGRDLKAGETEVDTIPPYIVTSDLFHVFQLGPMIAGGEYWNYTLTPFIFKDPVKGGTVIYHDNLEHDGFHNSAPFYKNPPPSIRKKYDIAGEIREDSEGRRVLKVDMHRELPPAEVPYKGIGPRMRNKEIVAKTIVNGTMYIDMEKKRLLSFEGELTGYKAHAVIPYKKGVYKVVRIPATCQIHMDYTHKRGFTEIEKSYCTITCEQVESKLFLTNLGRETDKKGRKVRLHNNLPFSIKEAGYNAELMESMAVKEAMGQAMEIN